MALYENVPVSYIKDAMEFIGYGEDTIKELFELTETLISLEEDQWVYRVSELSSDNVGDHVRVFSRQNDFRAEGTLTAYHPARTAEDRAGEPNWRRELGLIMVIDGQFYEMRPHDAVVVTRKGAA